jgi:flagellar basal-body rod protein FlgG
MIRSLYSAATGMRAQQLFVDNISNNLSNVNTTGFKKSKLEFADLIYQNIEEPGENVSGDAPHPTGLQVGLGVKPVANQRIFTQGNPVETGNVYDFAILGEGFFQVVLPDGQIAYTRDGSFKLTEDGTLVTSGGHRLEPEIVIPQDMAPDGFVIDERGNIFMQLRDSDQQEEAGQLELARFVNPSGLKALGGNLYAATTASGEPLVDLPGVNGTGLLRQRYLESSNVLIVEEMVSMIMAQRAYEISSKGVTTADEMLQIANQLKR